MAVLSVVSKLASGRPTQGNLFGYGLRIQPYCSAGTGGSKCKGQTSLGNLSSPSRSMKKKMDDSLKSVHKNMVRLGLGALAHANWHAHYFSHENRVWSELSVIQAAHAAEILIKARIAQEHPLLIFEQMPKPNSELGPHLTYQKLVEQGRTFQYFDLPDRL